MTRDPFAVEPVPEPAHPPVTMPGAWKKHVFPLRGTAGNAKPLDASRATLASAIYTMPDDAFLWQSALDDAVGPCVDAINQAFGRDREKLDPMALVDDWVERGGLAAACRVLDAVTGDPRHGAYRRSMHMNPMLHRLAQHVVAATDTDWQSARDEADRRVDLNSGSAARMAALFAGDADLFGRAVANGASGPTMQLAVTSAADLAAFEPKSGRGPQHGGGTWPLVTLLERLGPDLVPWVAGWSSWRQLTVSEAKPFAAVLAAIADDEAIRVLANLSGSPAFAPTFTKVAGLRPHGAVRALAPRLASSNEAVRGVIESIVRSQPGVVADVADTLEADVLDELRELAGPVSAVPVAADDRIPALLVAPPWKDRSAAAARGDGTDRLPKRMPKLPDFLRLITTTPPLLRDDGEALSGPAVEHLAMMLRISSLDDRYPGIDLVIDALDPASTAAWARELFAAWQIERFPSAHLWIFDAQAHVGDAATIREMVPLMRVWPGEGGHRRAVHGLDVLAAMGTDDSLEALSGLTRRGKYRALKHIAGQKLAEVAAARGLTDEELADRLVPDLGLDRDGSSTLDFGARTFTVGFDHDLKPFVRDDKGKARKSLPKPAQADDPRLAEAARQRLTRIRSDARTVATDQILRLERAMCAQRRWRIDDFRARLIDHPLMVHLVRRLVWTAHADAAGGTAIDSFRVAEDRTFADATDSALAFDGIAAVGLGHRLLLGEAVTATWTEVFADYELIQPFDQLERAVFELTDDELTSIELQRFVDGRAHPVGRFLGLEKLGWTRGDTQDGGIVHDMVKYVADGIAVHVELDNGIITGAAGNSEPSRIITVRLGDGSPWRRTPTHTFADLGPIVRSEIVRDLSISFPPG